MSEVCAACGLDVAAHRVQRGGRVFCCSYCSEHAAGDVDAGTRACASTSREPTAELDAIARELGPDEIRVLVAIARRLALGRSVYGPLDVKGDARDWRKEATEEACDLSVYLTAELLRQR